MRKHFLLLFLMALLPLAGWAESYEVKVRAMAFEIYYGAATPTEVQDGMFMVTDWNGYPGDVDDKATVSAAIKAKLSFTSERAANSNVSNIPFTLSVADGDFVQRGGDYFFINIANANGTFKQLKAAAPIITAPAYVTSDLVYTSNEQSLLNAEALGTATVGTLTVGLEYAISTYDGAWSVPGDGDWGAENYKVTNAGKYKVLYRAVASDNYEPASDELTEKVVAPADLTAAWEVAGATPTANTWTYDTEAHALVIAPTAAIKFGTTAIPYEYCATNSVNDADWTTDLSGFTAASNTENKTVYWRVKETANYSGHAATALTATITKATPTFTTEPTFAESRAYNGEELVQIVSAGETTLGAQPVFRRRTKSGNGSWGSWSEWKEDLSYFTRTNAGVCQIQYTTRTTNDLNPAIASPYGGPVTIEISKVTIAAESFTAPAAIANLVYSGGDQALITAGSWGENPELGTFQYSLTNDGTDWSADIPQATNADGYNVYYKIVPTDATNCEEYVAADPIAAAIGKATIPAASFNAPVAATGLKADGNAHALVTAASWIAPNNYGTFEYSLTNDGTDWSEDVPEGTDAGTYNVYFRINPTDGNNYNVYAAAEAIAVTIGDYKPILIIPDGKSKAYGSNDPALTYTIQDLDGNTLDLALQGVTLARTQGEAAGEYTIYVKGYEPAAADAEYTVLNVLGNPTSTAEYNKTAVFTIQATGNLVLKFTDDAVADKSSKIYDATASLTDLAFDNDDLEVVSGLLGTDDWTALKGSANITFALKTTQGETPSGKVNVGDYQVVATYSDGLVNYASVTIEPLDFTVTERPLKINVENQEVAYGVNISKVYGTNWGLIISGSDYGLATGDVITDTGIELYTVEDINAYAPGSENEDAIQARIPATFTSNYKINETGNDWGKLTITAVSPTTVLALNSEDADYAKINAYDGQNVKVTIDFTARNARTLPAGTARTWTADTWVTLTLPFDISVADLSKALGYAIVNVIDKSRTEVSGTSSKFYGKLTMKGGNGDGTEDYLVANKPFMVKTADAINGAIDFGTQTIVAPASADDLSVEAGGGAKFTGTYATKNVTSADNAAIWFMIGGNRQSWAYITTTSSAAWDILPFEGFIDMSSLPAQARSNMTFYFEEIDGSTTAIKSINADDLNGKIAAEGMYNMNGMKLNTVPTQKGVYILNGKKVVIK